MHILLMTALLAGSPPAHAQALGPQLDAELDTGFGLEPTAVVHPCPATVLRDGVQLPEAPGLYKRWHPEHAWGTQVMIDVLTAATDEMAWLMPEADPLVVGDISTQHGGFLQGHKSHRGGLDADIGLYWGNGQQHMQGFMVVSPQQLDAQANWLLINAMMQTGMVERILLDRHLIDMIRKWTIVNGELTREEADRIFPPIDTPNVWALSGVVHHAANHKHHMHVRVKCASS